MEGRVVRIASLAEHPDLAATIGRWHWNEWGAAAASGSLHTWTANLRAHQRDRIPTTCIALDGDTLLGSVSLVEHDMNRHLDWTPWLAGLYVDPPWRGRGVGRLLVEHAVREVGRI
jgi:GNAT superfamily N-acetyltransferase